MIVWLSSDRCLCKNGTCLWSRSAPCALNPVLWSKYMSSPSSVSWLRRLIHPLTPCYSCDQILHSATEHNGLTVGWKHRASPDIQYSFHEDLTIVNLYCILLVSYCIFNLCSCLLFVSDRLSSHSQTVPFLFCHATSLFLLSVPKLSFAALFLC